MKVEGNPLRVAATLAQAGRTDEAVACLEAALAGTRADIQRPGNTSLLARTAGLLCTHAGRLLQAASYYDEAVAAGSPEPLTLVALADVRFRLGRADEARACLARAETLAQSSCDGDTMKVIAATRARWAGDEG